MNEYVDKINRLSKLDKLKIYMGYFIANNSLKNNFFIKYDYIIEKYPNPEYADSTICGIKRLDYLWKDIYIQSFDEFISEENIRIIDNGDDWNKNGFAQRIMVDYFGIYEWYWKTTLFKPKI